jgi:hypothetical protein
VIPHIILLLVFPNRVMNVVTAQSAAHRRTIMTFTIDNENNISAFGSAEEAAAATATPFESFSSQKELAGLVAGWPDERLIATWVGLPGVEPVKKFENAKSAASRIWERIQSLGEAAKPAAEPAKPKADKNAKRGAQAAKGAPPSPRRARRPPAPRKRSRRRRPRKRRKPPGRGRAARQPRW